MSMLSYSWSGRLVLTFMAIEQLNKITKYVAALDYFQSATKTATLLVLCRWSCAAMREVIVLSLWVLFSTCFYRSQCVQRSCPSLAAQEGDPGTLDSSHFAAYIDTQDFPGKGADLPGNRFIVHGRIYISYIPLCISAASKVHFYILCAGLNASMLGDRIDLVTNGEVTSFFTTASRVMTLASIYPDVILPGDLSPIPIHMQLDGTASQEVCV